MSIEFSAARWERVREAYSRWWDGALERPLLSVVLYGKEPDRPAPAHPWQGQASFADLSVTPEQIVDSWDYELSRYRFLGDAFPFADMVCSGPGVAAAFLGAELDCSTGRIWFHPRRILPLSELHFTYDGESVWLERVREICRLAMERWEGVVQVGMPDLGGVLDVLASFRGAENLLMDLYDEPDEVRRTVWEIHHLWHRYYQEINELLQPVNPGYCDWAGIYSDTPSYVLQCDFSYMISPDMFNEFVAPELKAAVKRLSRTMYHLDGAGQLAHLDTLLQMEELDAVQWVPGDGKPDQRHWPEVYRRIAAAGKKTQIWGGFKCLETVAQQMGTARGIEHSFMFEDISQERTLLRQLAEYGVE